MAIVRWCVLCMYMYKCVAQRSSARWKALFFLRMCVYKAADVC